MSDKSRDRTLGAGWHIGHAVSPGSDSGVQLSERVLESAFCGGTCEGGGGDGLVSQMVQAGPGIIHIIEGIQALGGRLDCTASEVS